MPLKELLIRFLILADLPVLDLTRFILHPEVSVMVMVDRRNNLHAEGDESWRREIGWEAVLPVRATAPLLLAPHSASEHICLLHPTGKSILRVDSDTSLTRGYGQSDVFGGHQVKAASIFIMRHRDDERGSPVVEDVFALAHKTNALENFVRDSHVAMLASERCTKFKCSFGLVYLPRSLER